MFEGLWNFLAGPKDNSPERDINILLLGETGVGKSTFINAFANYVVYRNFEKAEKSGPLILIPVTISVGVETVTIGKDSNEYEEVGASATQHVKTYSFPLKKPRVKIRLIDTPGLADTRGIEQDEINCELILDYISTLKEIHAFCIVLKANIARITAQFEYCIKQILMRLEKSAAKNIIFVVTNTRTCGYGGGLTIPCLEKFVSGIREKPPHVDIPLIDGKSVFYLENECFKYLVAVKNHIKKFTKQETKNNITSWEKSSEQCWQLLNYLTGANKKQFLKPHQVENTISINEARKLIVQLSEPLAEISRMISDNIDLLNKHEAKLKQTNQALESLKANLYIPGIDLKVTPIQKPITVCADLKCCEVIRIEGKEKWHYKQRCHQPCPLNGVKKEIIGDPKLATCKIMDSKGFCTACKCYFDKHMHIYYLTEFIDGKITDKDIERDVETQEKALKEAEKIIHRIKSRKETLEEEHETIIRITAQFVHFLQNNAITPFDDSYKTYINFLIDCERSRGEDCNKQHIENMENLLQRHDAAKAVFDKAVEECSNGQDGISSSRVSAQSILESIQQLLQLKLSGPKIREIYEKQKICLVGEHKTMNLVYEHPTLLPGFNEDEDMWIFINF